MIFRVTFAVLYRRIWSITGNYSILCCDRWLLVLEQLVTVGAFSWDCWTNILVAMSDGCVKMLLCWSTILSRGGESALRNITLFPYLGLVLIRWRNLDMAFCMLLRLCLVMIVLASFCALLPMVAISFSHSIGGVGGIGSGGSCMEGWFERVWRIGFCCHCGLFLTMLMILRMRWCMAMSFFHVFWGFCGRKPPSLLVVWVSVGSGGEEHVVWIVKEIWLMILSKAWHASCHWWLDGWG
jgi:hypothetical protein